MKDTLLRLISFLSPNKSNIYLYFIVHVIGISSIILYLVDYDIVKRLVLTFIYFILVVLFFIRPSVIEGLSIRWIIIYGYLFRVVVLVFFIYGNVFSLAKSDWTGFLLKDFYSPTFYVLALFLEFIIVYSIKLILDKYSLSANTITLYMWNPFVIDSLYNNFDPFIIWIALILLVFIFLIYNKRLLSSILFGLSMAVHGLSFLMIFALVRGLKGYLLIAIGIFIGLLFIPGHADYFLSSILYSGWLQRVFSFFRDIEFSYGYLVNDKVILLLPFILSILVWISISKVNVLNKVHNAIFIYILVYPNGFSDIGILLIVLSAVFRNISLLIFSLYIYCLPLLNGIDGFSIYNSLISYILLISLSILMFIKGLYYKTSSQTIKTN